MHDDDFYKAAAEVVASEVRKRASKGAVVSEETDSGERRSPLHEMAADLDELDKQELEKQRDEARAERNEARETRALDNRDAEKMIEDLTTERDDALAARNHAKKDCIDWAERCENVTKERDIARAEREEARAEVKLLRKERDHAQEELADKQAVLSLADETIEILTKERDDARAEVELLRKDGYVLHHENGTDIPEDLALQDLDEQAACEQVHTLTSRVIDAIERRTKCQGVDPEQVSIRGYFVQGNLQWMVSTMGWSATAPASLEQAFDNLIQLILEDRK